MRCVSAIFVLAALAGGCAAHAADVGQVLQGPREPIPIPNNIVDIVPTAAPRPLVFNRRDIDFGARKMLVVDGSADVARTAQVGHFHVAFSARYVPETPVRPLELRDAQPIVAALIASGIAATDISETLRQEPFQSPQQSGRPGAVDITFAIEHPSEASARRLSEAIDSASGYPTFHAFTTTVFALADCTEPLAEARREALENARTIALARARQARLRLGALLEVHEVFAGVARGQCGSANPGGIPVQLDIKVPVPDPLDVIVGDQLTLTYAVR